MPRSVTVQIGEDSYTVPALTMGEIEELSAFWEATHAPDEAGASSMKHAISLAALVLREAEPKVEDVRKLRCTPEELRSAIDAVLRVSGLKPAEVKAAKGEAQSGSAA